MLRSVTQLTGYRIAALDGTAGTLREVYFDDTDWTVRYLVVDTGTWLPGRLILISPVAAGEPDWETKTIPVQLRKEKIESGPLAEEAKPVSRRFEKALLQHYGWPHNTQEPAAGAATPGPPRSASTGTPGTEDSEDAGLRSSAEVTGYSIQATDGEIGHVEDFIFDDETFTLRYIVVDTRNWLPGSRKVLVAVPWVERVEWAAPALHLDLTKEQIENSPEYDPAEPINRRYEARLYDFYGRPRYWAERTE